MGLIRFLLFSIVILYAVRLIVRIFLPMLFRSIISDAQQHAQQQYQRPRQPEGKVKVDYIPQNKSNVPDSEGEFVDYEEVK